MPRTRLDRRGRTLTQEQRKSLVERAKAIKKTKKKRKATPSEILQIVFVVLVISGIVFVAFRLAK